MANVVSALDWTCFEGGLGSFVPWLVPTDSIFGHSVADYRRSSNLFATVAAASGLP
jgi:hypothetical protein